MREISFFSRTTLRSAMILFLIGSLAVSEVAAARQRTHYGLTISGTPASGVLAGQTYTFTPTAYDSRTRTLVFAIANRPSWATFSSSNGQLSGTPTAANVGTYSSIVIAVSDGYRTATLPAFSVSVSAVAGPAPPRRTATAADTAPPPVISGTPPTSVQAGSSYAFQPTASDPGGLTLAFSVQNKPAWATFSIVNGLLSGTPGSSQAGTYANVVISASDGQHTSALPAFSINVTFGAGGHRDRASGSDRPDSEYRRQRADGSCRRADLLRHVSRKSGASRAARRRNCIELHGKQPHIGHLVFRCDGLHVKRNRERPVAHRE